MAVCCCYCLCDSAISYVFLYIVACFCFVCCVFLFYFLVYFYNSFWFSVIYSVFLAMFVCFCLPRLCVSALCYVSALTTDRKQIVHQSDVSFEECNTDEYRVFVQLTVHLEKLLITYRIGHGSRQTDWAPGVKHLGI